jgi:hypothetical protein
MYWELLSGDKKRPGHKAKHSPSTSAEFKKAWVYTSTPPYAFMALCLVKRRHCAASRKVAGSIPDEVTGFV